MESLTRLVTESLARHGFDRPLDYRRLRWSRWFRCESHHSLLLVPSKPGIFAVAEEITEIGTARAAEDPLVRPASEASVKRASSSPVADTPRRMLAVTQFFEADDMAFVLDRMLVHQNPMRDRLNSGRYFVRFVIIEEAAQRRSVRTALNQWLADASEKATGIPAETAGIAAHFAGSLELTSATEYVPASVAAQSSLFENAAAVRPSAPATSKDSLIPGEMKTPPMAAQQLDSGSATNIHCPLPFPSGF
jgi:hypothetical protein